MASWFEFRWMILLPISQSFRGSMSASKFQDKVSLATDIDNQRFVFFLDVNN